KLPVQVVGNQADMGKDWIACTPEFKIDRYKVSNGEYHAFWKSLPEKERQKPDVRAALYPLAWAESDPPFPKDLTEVPVLGVPLTGAQAYAHSQGKRLPTPYEWCRAALGPLGDAVTPEWVLLYLKDRQLTWPRLVLNHYAYLRAAEPAVLDRIALLNIDRAA